MLMYCRAESVSPMCFPYYYLSVYLSWFCNVRIILETWCITDNEMWEYSHTENGGDYSSGGNILYHFVLFMCLFFAFFFKFSCFLSDWFLKEQFFSLKHLNETCKSNNVFLNMKGKSSETKVVTVYQICQ